MLGLGLIVGKVWIRLRFADPALGLALALTLGLCLPTLSGRDKQFALLEALALPSQRCRTSPGLVDKVTASI